MKFLSSIFKNLKEKPDFSIRSVFNGHHHITYRGIQTLKCPFDYVIYQMIIMQLKPDLVIEIGTRHGGSTLYIADLLDIIGGGIIHSIDINTPPNVDILVANPRIKLFDCGWQGYDLNQAKDFSNVLVIDDASHIYEDAIGSLRKFAPLVTQGSYFIMEDGIIDELGISKDYRGGPLKAIYEFLKDNDNFVVDREWCDMFGNNATFNVDGYLKKVR